MTRRRSVRLLPEDRRMLEQLESAEAFHAAHGARVDTCIETARSVVRQTLDFQEGIGARPPWTGYLCVDESSGEVVGCGGFKGNPDADGAVEIAYFTFPPFEARGHGTATARALLEVARANGAPPVLAHTLPERNASTRILERVGFVRVGEAEDEDAGPVWRWRLAAAGSGEAADVENVAPGEENGNAAGAAGRRAGGGPRRD